MSQESLDYILIQISPFRIHALYKVNFLFSVPRFELLFSFDSCVNMIMEFIVYKECAIISCCEAFWIRMSFVLIDASSEKTGHSNIESTISTTCEDIHISLLHRIHIRNYNVHGSSRNNFHKSSLIAQNDKCLSLRTE